MTELPLPARPYLAPIWNELDGVVRLLRPRGGGPPAAADDGDGTPVLLLPGFLASGGALDPLAARLAADGHRPWIARIGRNLACSEVAVGRVLHDLEVAAARHGSHVLVGHSRGGLLALVVARRRPDLVAGVVTLGSPHRDQLAIHPFLWAQALALAAAGTLGLPGSSAWAARSGRAARRSAATSPPRRSPRSDASRSTHARTASSTGAPAWTAKATTSRSTRAIAG